MKKIILMGMLFIPLFVLAENGGFLSRKAVAWMGETGPIYHPQGTLQVGMRTTSSLFNHDGGPGYGVGGQFRLWLFESVNSEWFADYITTDLDGLGKRVDGHIGWSIMFYPAKGLLQSKFNPYFLAGHCFDYTKVTPFNTVTELNSINAIERWSSATQIGAGVHWNITEKFNLSFSTQYMIHLGNNIHTHIDEHNGILELHVEEIKGASMEGHLLTTLSLNVRLGDLW